MSSKSHKPDFNELEYISWKEFRKMAPAIIRLEINRTGKLLKEFHSDSDMYNTLIKTRYELTQFVQCLEQTNGPPLPDSCSGHLSKAILNLSLEDAGEMSDEIQYILGRLKYVYDRIEMIY